MAAFGLPASAAKSFEEAPLDVWESNWKTLELFIAMQTQWLIGMNGLTGLNYAALPIVAKSLNIKLTRSRFKGIRVMESEALRVIAENGRQQHENRSHRAR